MSAQRRAGTFFVVCARAFIGEALSPPSACSTFLLVRYLGIFGTRKTCFGTGTCFSPNKPLSGEDHCSQSPRISSPLSSCSETSPPSPLALGNALLRPCLRAKRNGDFLVTTFWSGSAPAGPRAAGPSAAGEDPPDPPPPGEDHRRRKRRRSTWKRSCGRHAPEPDTPDATHLRERVGRGSIRSSSHSFSEVRTLFGKRLSRLSWFSALSGTAARSRRCVAFRSPSSSSEAGAARKRRLLLVRGPRWF